MYPASQTTREKKDTMYTNDRKKEYSLSLSLHHISADSGIALVMTLVLSAVVLVIIAGLIYMITSATQISGIQKRYRTALEAGIGGAEIAYQVIGLRGEADSLASLQKDLSALNLTVTTPASCATLMTNAFCASLGNFDGLSTKSKLPTSCWSGCDYLGDIDPSNTDSYDISLELAGMSSTYTVYAKIVDTVLGNTGGDEGLLKRGVVSVQSGEIPVKGIPYLYTIEVDAEDAKNPSERARLSILYQY
jgi:hypothetical protein